MTLHSHTVDASDEATQAAQFVERVVGNAWATDAEGRFIYVTPIVLEHLGLTLEDLNAETTDGVFGWKRVVHPADYEAAASTWARCLRTGEHYNVEHRLLGAGGAYAWERCSGQPVKDAQGRILGWYGTVIMTDAYKKTEDALRARERELEQLIDIVPSHIWRLNADGEPIFFNKRMADFLDMEVTDTERPGESRRQAIVAAVHPEDAAQFVETLDHSLATGEPFAMQYRLRRADGVYRWMSSRAEPMRDDGGRIAQWFGLCHDIDDQMRLYGDIAEREAQIRRLVDSDIIGIVIWDLDGTLIDANDAFLRMVQYEREDVKAGLRWLDMTPPDWQDVHAHEEAEELAATGRMQAREKEYFRKDGSRVPVLIGAACFEGQSRQGVAFILDLTERKRAEDALRRNKQQLEQMIDALPINILSFDPSQKLTYASQRYHDAVGAPLVHGRDFESLVREVAHPEDLPAMLRRALNGFATGEPFVNRFRRLCSDGIYRWIEARAQALRDPRDEIVQWYIVSIDIEEEMQAQEALRERERFLWQLVETLPAMIDCAAPDGEPVYRSQQLREFLGYNLEELDGTGKSRLGGTLDAGVHPDDIAAVVDEYAYSLRTGEPYARRHRLKRFDGEFRWVETRAAPMRNADGAIVQWNVICLDIDAEVRAQEELRLAQDRLARASQAASLAELSASIAHEVNQPLAAVVTNSHACQRWLTADPPNMERAQRTIERIIRDANAAADVVGQIRALFKQNSEPRAQAPLAEIVSEARRLLADLTRKMEVRVDVTIGADLPGRAFDSVQVQQVLINLMRNAAEAMETQKSERRLKVSAFGVGDMVQIEIADTGPGIAHPDKVFDAFYTTKDSGMGMGLAISRSIVDSQGGRLWFRNNEAGGATFAFTLPAESQATK